jgi:hypothetical protein
MFLFAGTVSSEAARCAGSGRYRLSHDANWPMFISARAGTTCEATFGAAGSASYTYKRLFLVKAPSRGKVNLREGGYYIYTARASAGADSFTLRVCGSEDGKPGCATLEYTVTVN